MAELEKLNTAKTLDRWVAVFSSAFKGATVLPYAGRFDFADIARLSIKPPAIFVSVLSAQPADETGDGTLQAETVFSAFIITGGSARDTAGLNMQEALRSLLFKTESKVTGAARPKKISWMNVWSGGEAGKQVALQAVAWQQRIVIGEQNNGDEMFTGGLVWPDDVVPDEIYIESGGVIEPEKPPAPDLDPAPSDE